MKTDLPLNVPRTPRVGRPIQEIEAELFADFDAKYLDNRKQLTATQTAEATAELQRVIRQLGG